MEYYVFVPVDEFLKNGGVLEYEHQFYKRSSIAGIFDTFGWYDPKNQIDYIDEEMLIVTRLDRSFQYHKSNIYVMVKAIPQYK